MANFFIGKTPVGDHHPTYFIAEIGSNFDGSMQRAKDLIGLAKECGANAVKFQHYTAASLINDFGFDAIQTVADHQKTWKGTVFDTYEKASLRSEWTHALKLECDHVGVDFFTSPYSMSLVDEVDRFVPAFKIGSGDITWTQIAEHMASKGKPLLLATGASTLEEVRRVYDACMPINHQMVIMQCNTNYTGSLDNFKFVNLGCLSTFATHFPNAVLGLSDHTPGSTAVLGAIALGAKVVEKHFTDDKTRQGPDHAFAMDPVEWREMIEASRLLECALGNGVKDIEQNEIETMVVQRRSICASKALKKGDVLTAEDLDYLRPCPADALPPYEAEKLIGKTLRVDLAKGDFITFSAVKVNPNEK